MDAFTIKHHGAINGVTGSCHELKFNNDFGILIDCGLFQGAETSRNGADANTLKINFPVRHIKSLVVTHVHIDHVGRIPYLLAAGFVGPILCSQPSAHLLPLVLEDAVKIGFSRDPVLVRKFIAVLKKQIIALPYKHWFSLPDQTEKELKIRLQPAGHILGSAYVECDIPKVGKRESGSCNKSTRVIFSGDLGAPYAPLLPAPVSPYWCDTLVIESTYGDRIHPDRRNRKAALKAVLKRALSNKGVLLIPAFSIGRTQEVLYELEAIIAQELRCASEQGKTSKAKKALDWSRLPIIVDSPLASRFTESYRHLKPFWDEEALSTLQKGRDPLHFDQLHTVGSHRDHMKLLKRLEKSHEPCVVIAASGMCAGGRVVNYLKALIGEPRTDILFVGYQAEGTPGRDIVNYGKQKGYVELDDERFKIRAGIHQISGYSAHADQGTLVNFVKRMQHKPSEIRLIHGDKKAKQVLCKKLKKCVTTANVWIPD